MGYNRIEQALGRGKKDLTPELRSAFYVDVSNINVTCVEEAFSYVASCTRGRTLDGEVSFFLNE